jgi:hypothetical protein
MMMSLGKRVSSYVLQEVLLICKDACENRKKGLNRILSLYMYTDFHNSRFLIRHPVCIVVFSNIRFLDPQPE